MTKEMHLLFLFLWCRAWCPGPCISVYGKHWALNCASSLLCVLRTLKICLDSYLIKSSLGKCPHIEVPFFQFLVWDRKSQICCGAKGLRHLPSCQPWAVLRTELGAWCVLDNCLPLSYTCDPERNSLFLVKRHSPPRLLLLIHLNASVLF